MGESRKKDGPTPKAPQNQEKSSGPVPQPVVPGLLALGYATGVDVSVVDKTEDGLGDVACLQFRVAGGATLEIRFPMAMSEAIESAIAESRREYQAANGGDLHVVEKKLIVPEGRA